MRPWFVIGFAGALLSACGGARPPASGTDGQAEAARPEQDAPPDVPRLEAGDGGASDVAPNADGRDAPSTPVNDACAFPTSLVLDATNPSAHGWLDFAGPGVAACGVAAEGALFYSVEVPAGHRLAASAKVTAGDRPWMPRLVAFGAFGACDQAACLAQGSVAGGTEQRLFWINNGQTSRFVTLSVSAGGPVVGAEFDVGVGVTDLFPSCARPIPVQDGTLINRSLASVQPSGSSCGLRSEPTLTYVATLLPQQELDVVAMTNNALADVTIGLRSACDDECSGSGSHPSTINRTSEDQTVLIEVRPAGPTTGLFDLHVSITPPPPGIVVTPTSSLVTTEGGGRATFQVVLASRPTASVGLALASDQPSEGTPSPAALTFDATSWNRPQTVTVMGADDQLGDGARTYAIVTAPAASADPFYAGLDADDVPLTNLDDEASLRVEGADDVVTSEDGAAATFTLRLNLPPTGAVTVPLASSDGGEGTVSPASVTFTAADWNEPRIVTVTGVDDADVDGPQAFTIGLGPLVSGDARYDGLKPAPIAAHNRDNDFTSATTMIVGSPKCGVAGTPNQFPVAMDALGRIYVVIYCDDRLVLFTSADGGRTFSEPRPILAARERLTGSFAIAAGRGGTAYLVFGVGERGLQLARTTDAGLTWSRRTLMPLLPDLLRIRTARDTVVIAGTNPLPGGKYSGSIVLRSEDGGRSFAAPTLIADQQMSALAVGPDGKSVWLVGAGPGLLKSGDGGATFQNFGHIDGPGQQCCYVFGTSDAYAITNSRVTTANLSDPTKSAEYVGPLGPLLAATIDDADVVTIFMGNTLGRRFVAGGPIADSVVAVPEGVNLAGAVALSRHATGLAAVTYQGALFSVVTWP